MSDASAAVFRAADARRGDVRAVDARTDDAEWAPCSDRSRERADPLAATASRGLQWFLVEVEGPWGANAFVSSALGRELGQTIVNRIEAAGMRPLAIRRVNRAARDAADAPRGRSRPPQSVWRWAFVDARLGFEEVRWGAVTDPHELLKVPLDGSTGIHSAQPIYCVCTHAKHDQCCAVRGRPVALALAEQYPAETWECSHLGGDRFAGTMAVFPEGLYFGRADDANAVQIVRDYTEGRVDERFFRGRSSLSHPVQAAQHFARERFSVDRLDAFAPLREHAVAGGRSGVHEVELALGDGAPATATATFTATDAGTPATGSTPGDPALGGTIRVVVAERLSEPLLSTCAATRFGRVREFDLVSIASVPL